MNRRHTTQASGQGILEHVFKLREHDATARTEAIAGLATFLMMVYVVLVDPQVLGIAGMDTSTAFVTTYLIVAFGSIMMGLLVSPPAVPTPAMGLNAFFTFVAVQAMDLLQQVGMSTIFWGAIGLLLLTILRVRYWMIANIPVSPRVGVTSGVGLLIGMMELKNAGVIVANPKALVSIGSLTSHSVLLGTLGFFIIVILASRNIHAAVLVSIVVTALLGRTLGDIHYDGIVSAPPSVTTAMGHVDLAGLFNLGLAGMIFLFILVNLFDSSDTLVGVTDKIGLADGKGRFPCIKQALYISSISSVTSSFVRTSSIMAYTKSSSGISIDGRTDLTVVVVGLLLLLVIFLSPLVGMVPDCATTGALIYVDVLMTSSLAHANRQDLTESVPAFITIMTVPFSLPITEDIALGFIFYCMVEIDTGHLRGLGPCIITVALLFILKIVFIDAHQNR